MTDYISHKEKEIDNDMVSVIIPVYNRGSELQRAISSVLVQSWQNFEVIIVDDGSDIDIKSICDSFNDNRISYFRNNKHINANVARNKGIKEAQGKYIAMLDSDDEFLPNHLIRRIEKIKKWKCDGIFGSAYFKNGTTKQLILSRPRENNELMINYLLSDGFAPTPSHFYRREAALEIMWDENMERHQDFDFTVRFSNRFIFLSDYEPTIIVDRSANEKKNYNYDSCIKFIEKHKDKIQGRIYNSYHFLMYSHAQNNATINIKITTHYAHNSYKYIYAVPFYRFVLVHNINKFFYVFIFIKFIFLHLVFFLRAIFLNDMPSEIRNNI